MSTAPPAGERPPTRASDFLTELFRTPLDPGYADAAHRRAREPEQPAWRRTTRRYVRIVILAAIGFLLAVSYQYAVASEPEASRARAGLVTDVRDRRAAADDMQLRADRLREEVARLRASAFTDSREAARLRELEALTGLARVKGDGVAVRLADGPPQVDPVTGKQNPTNPGQVQDRDLQDIANELWRLGAEAIAINGERLIATSTIRSAGEAILVDVRPITAPFEVTAIGPDKLKEQFAKSRTAKRFGTYVKGYRMEFSVKARKNLTLPAAVDPQLRYAQPPPPLDPHGAGTSRPSSGTPVPSASGGGK